MIINIDDPYSKLLKLLFRYFMTTIINMEGQYILGNMIGSGSFGKIYVGILLIFLAKSNSFGEVAVKLVSINNLLGIIENKASSITC